MRFWQAVSYTGVVLFMVLSVGGSACKGRSRSASALQSGGPLSAGGDRTADSRVDDFFHAQHAARAVCGSGEADTNTSPATGDALSLAGGSSCYCPTVKIGCRVAAGAGALATCHRESCQVTLHPDMCRQLGLSEGQKVKPESVFATYPAYTNASDIYRYCTAGHEFRHACDDPSRVRLCHSEVIAFSYSIDCLNHYDAALGCQSGRPADACYSLVLQLESHNAAKFLNLCQCNGGKKQACVESCQGRYSATTCRKMADLYMAD